MDFVYSKVIIITSEFPPHLGGIGNHAFNLADQLVLQKHKVVVITVSYPELINAAGFDANLPFEIRRVNGRRINKLINVVKAVLRESPRKSLVISSGMLMLLAGFLVKFLSGCKVIGIAHGLDVNPSNPFYKLFVRISLFFTDGIIAVSNYTASKIPKRMHPKLVVINNGFNINLFQNFRKHDFNKNYLSIVTVGSLSERKGQMNVIRAIPELLKCFPHVHYDIIGLKTSCYSLLMQEAINLKVESNVTFHGALMHKDLCSVVERADIFAMLSMKTKNGDFEGFGIAIIEANALGIPAIGSRATGIEDAIADGFSGFLINPVNQFEFVDAVMKITNSYNTFSLNAATHARAFAWERVIMKYISFFKRIGYTVKK